MKITLGGRLVYLGEGDDVYVYVKGQSQGDSPEPVAHTEDVFAGSGVLLDFAEDGTLIGVEILARS